MVKTVRARVSPAVLVLAVLAGGCGGNRAESHFAAGDRHFKEKEYEAAAQDYRAGLDLNPASAAAWNRLGMACRLQFNASRESEWKDQEIEAFRHAVVVDSTYWAAYVNLGATLYYLGQKSDAAPYIRRSLELYPENPDRAALEALLGDSTLSR